MVTRNRVVRPPAPARDRSRKLRAACVAALACLGVTVAACGGSGDNSSTSTGGSGSADGGRPTATLTIAENFACGVLDPAFGTAAAGYMDMTLAYEPLIRMQPGGKLVPGLAASWEIEPGNRAIVFTLRENARFSDGELVTADAVKQWLELRDSVESPLDYVMGEIAKVEVLDRFVVRVELKEPNPTVAQAFSNSNQSNWGFVTSPKAIAKVKGDPKRKYLSKRTVGAGQYVLDPAQSVTGDHCTWVPNKYYYDQSKIKFAKVVTRQIPDANSLLAAMQTGQVDVGIGDSGTADAARSAGLRVVFTPARLQGLYFLDKTGRLNPALADRRVRQALNYAVDRETIAKSLFGDAVPSSNPNPTSDGDDPATRNYYDYNPEKARRLLADAGYADGFTIRTEARGPFIGSYKTTPMAQAIARYLAEVGVRLDIVSTPSLAEFFRAIDSRTFDATSTIFGTAPTWAWYPLAMKTGGTIADQHGFNDPVSQRLWEEGSVASPEEQPAIWKKLMNRTIEEAYFLPILSPGHYAYFNDDRVEGVGTPLIEGGWGPADGWTPAE